MISNLYAATSREKLIRKVRCASSVLLKADISSVSKNMRRNLEESPQW